MRHERKVSLYSTRKREFLLDELEYQRTILRYKAEISKICDSERRK